MTQFAQQLKTEISRIARKEIRSDQDKLKKLSASARSEVSALKARVAALEAQIKRLAKQSAGGSAKAAVESEDSKQGLRFQAKGFASLRKKFGLSAADMGKLLGVSAQSVYHWEIGKSKPQAKQLASISEARKLGKKEVAAKLAGESVEVAETAAAS